MKRGFRLAIGLAAALLLAACAREPIHKAVGGGLLPTEENSVVVNHCQGCHLHAKFVAEAHLAKVKARYAQGNPLREASRCLECHRLSLENIFRNETRRTEFPHGALASLPEIPKPAEAAAASAKKDAPKPEEKKKERKWYFFWLF
ncbi:MAG: hypothetical protein A3J27_04505 [Candidatus Tectomicrobia bacterium RIFCSPLOWO2_12_FULL_69_37]|nr:MAG: hypothetical protein A3J27_04505 [Candidatus Tectomicrobia bacterium RIFCSPLOWO2_12_FULL_69_37]